MFSMWGSAPTKFVHCTHVIHDEPSRKKKKEETREFGHLWLSA